MITGRCGPCRAALLRGDDDAVPPGSSSKSTWWTHMGKPTFRAWRRPHLEPVPTESRADARPGAGERTRSAARSGGCSGRSPARRPPGLVRGFSTEHDLQVFTRPAKATELSWGSAASHRERVARARGCERMRAKLFGAVAATLASPGSRGAPSEHGRRWPTPGPSSPR